MVAAVASVVESLDLLMELVIQEDRMLQEEQVEEAVVLLHLLQTPLVAVAEDIAHLREEHKDLEHLEP